MKSLTGLALFLFLLAAQAADMDKDCLATGEAFRTGNAVGLDAYAKRLRGHLLEPYVLYYQLRMRLEDASPEEVRAFAAAHHDSPLSEQLRAEWLKVLGRKQQWDLFDEEYPSLRDADIELTCYALQ